MTKIAEARYALGKAAQQDVLRSQSQLILLEARREKYEQEVQSREAEVNSLLARPLQTSVPQPYDVDPVEPFASLEDLYRQAEAHAPALAKEKSGVERSELALNLARKDGAIDYTIGGGVATMGSMGTMYQAKLDFNLPLFTRSRQRAAVLEQLSEVERARRSYQATGNQLLFHIKDDWLQSALSWRLMRLYSTTMVPQATVTLDSSLAAYENGQVDFMNVLSSLMSVLDAEMAYHEESLNYQMALLRLEEETGVTLVNDDPPDSPSGKSAAEAAARKEDEGHRSLTVAAPSPRRGSVTRRGPVTQCGSGEGGAAMKKVVFAVVLLACGFAGGYVVQSRFAAGSSGAAKSAHTILFWYDPMHPAYHSDKPGIAPDCGMTLVPMYSDGSSPAGAPAGTIEVPAGKQQSMGVETGFAEMGQGVKTLRAVGRVAVDETRVMRVQSRTEGWIEKVNVDYTGRAVKQGETLLTLYSPEIVASQEEYLLALKASETMKHASMQGMQESSDSLASAALTRLQRHWRLDPASLAELERTRKPVRTIPIYAPATSYVLTRNAYANLHVTPETDLYTLADLRHVWIMADVAEADAAQGANGRTGLGGAIRHARAQIHGARDGHPATDRPADTHVEGPAGGQQSRPHAAARPVRQCGIPDCDALAGHGARGRRDRHRQSASHLH